MRSDAYAQPFLDDYDIAAGEQMVVGTDFDRKQNRRRYCATSDEVKMAAETVVKPHDEGFALGEHEVL